MKTFEVTIRATATKTYTVQAECSEDACEEAHGMFSVLPDDVPEDYEQETIYFDEVENEDEEN